MTFIDLEKNITVFLKNESDKPVTYNLKIDDKQSKLVDIPANSLAAVQIRRK
jgi:hypothetical protein|tara:strand:- start:423 stop:578 length:156 start_codon:yes stop_codon:yes gene_type:complete